MISKKKVVILGAGIAGLSAGYFLSRSEKYEVVVIEKEPVAGGLCGSFKHDGFVLDYGAHKLYSLIPGIMDVFEEIMGKSLLKLPKRNRIFLKGQLLDYPLKMSNMAKVFGPVLVFQLGFGYIPALIKGLFKRDDTVSYEDYIVKRFGRPTYELVFEPLADKVWGGPSTLHPEIAKARIPASGGLEVILKLLGIKKETSQTNAEFFYYPREGFGAFPNTLRDRIKEMGGKILVNTKICRIERFETKIKSVIVDYKDETLSLPCDYLVSSIPLPDLGNLVFSDNDSGFHNAINGLQYRHLILVYIFVNRPIVLEDQWIFFPERNLIFSRIFEQKQMNPELGPEGHTAICCDFTTSEDGWQWSATNDELAEDSIKGLVEGGFIKSDEVRGYLVKRVKNFYPRYDLLYEDRLKTIYNKIKSVDNLILTGRIGMYNYNNADHCLDMGCFIAEKMTNNIHPNQILDDLIEHVRSYKIVD